MKFLTLHMLLRLLLRPLSTPLFIALTLLSAPLHTLSAEDVTSTQYPIPGQLVDIGTHRLHIYCLGSGSPAVIMDVGLGGISLEWLPVQRVLAEHVQACIYDRAGYGWSDPGPSPRTSSKIADELFALLNKARIRGPYILVGHSFGGYNMQLFASRYPYATAGLVLVDSSHAEQVERFHEPPINIKLAPSIKGEYVIVRFARPEVHPMIPEELKSIVYELLNRVTLRQAMGEEYLNYEQSAAEVQNERELPDVPLFVLTRGMRVWPETPHGDLMEELWLDLQSELAVRGPRHAHIVAARSGHYIHLDQPQLVIDAILEVIQASHQRRKESYTLMHEGMLNEAIPLFEHALLCSYTF
ncbi:MAG: alpha/beta hydrolase [Gammaproteobacteria bacterium]|nr:alpha/beta hydrolase [Gammaproteobacteria bacterium]